jgi:hypothetical protein
LVIVLGFVAPTLVAWCLFNFAPGAIARPLGYVIILVGVFSFLWSWFKRHLRRRGDQNELDVLEETVQEHERGGHDNSEYIRKQLFFIERDHKPTPEVLRLLERARRAIEN